MLQTQRLAVHRQAPFEQIQQRVVAAFHRHGQAFAAAQHHVQVERIGAATDHRGGDRLTVERHLAGHRLDLPAAGQIQTRHFGVGHVPVTGRLHLLRRGQVDPQLEAAQQTVLLLGHFLVDDAAPGGHPLHAALLEIAFVTQVITVLHVPFHQVGDGLEATVRMGREAGHVVVRIVGGERVQHQERIQPHRRVVAQRALQAHAGAIGCIQGTERIEYATLFHGCLLLAVLRGALRRPGSPVRPAGRGRGRRKDPAPGRSR